MKKIQKKPVLKKTVRFSKYLFLSIIIVLSSFLSIPFIANKINHQPIISLEPHNTISLDGNAALAAFPNKSGFGTPGSPYIIENLEIDAGGVGSAIDIRNTDKYLTILNCTLNNTGSTAAGIYLNNASQVTVRNCTITNNPYYGIYVSSTSMNVTIDNNTLYQSGTWGILTYSPNITIINNEISECDDYGILVQGDDTKVINNTIHDNWNVETANIRIESANCIVEGNTLYNGYFGVYIYGGVGTRVLSNDIYGAVYCIQMFMFPNNNVVMYNNLTGASQRGVAITQGAGNIIVQNNISDNLNYGIYLGGSATNNNQIYLNTFMNNGQQIYIFNPGTGNQFDNGTFGNYYSDYRAGHPTAKPVGPTNMTWDEPYQVDATQFDNFPLVSPWGLNWPPPPGETYGTILIDGNAELSAFPNKTGSGTPADPYIIANLDIDGNSSLSCLTIRNTDKNLIVRNSTFTNTPSLKAGIYLQNVTNIRIYNCTIFANDEYGIFVNESANMTIHNNNISRNIGGLGIYASYTESLNISDNIAVFNTAGGFQVYYCNSSSIFNNTITDSHDGIYLTNSISSTIQNNTILRGTGEKIEVDFSHYAKLINNTITDSTLYGISIDQDSDHLLIINNTFRNNQQYGLILSLTTQNCTVRGNAFIDDGGFSGGDATCVIDSNTVNGKPMYIYFNTNNLVPSNFTNAGLIILTNCNNSIIGHLSIEEISRGIQLKQCYHNVILNVTLVNCSSYGVYLSNSPNTTIKDCQITQSTDGIYGINSPYTNIEDCRITQVTYGIRFSSNNITCINNTVSHGQGDGDGIFLGGDYCKAINNTVYDFRSAAEPGGIRLDTNFNGTVVGNTVYDCSFGVYLYGADDSRILSNVIYDCSSNIMGFLWPDNNVIMYNNLTGPSQRGIEIIQGAGNIIVQNNISNNGLYGLYLGGSACNNNQVYLNNFIDNGVQPIYIINPGTGNQFDNGSLGNYYSDYRSLHPNATHDGTVWSEPYLIDIFNDSYPLVSPWGLNWTAQPPVLDPILPNPSKNGIIDLTWSCMGNVTQFHVYRNTSQITSVSGLTPIATVTTYNYIDNITTNDGYYYVIVSENDLGNSSISNCENVTIYIMPSVEILSPGNGNQFEEAETIPLVVNVTDLFPITVVQLYLNSTYIDNFTYNGSLYLYDWVSSIGDVGIQLLQIRAYNTLGIVNDTEAVWVNITLYIPPPEHADLYNVTTTNSTGSPQENFTRGEQVIYEITIRGDLGSGSYVVMAHTDDPTLNAYLTYNETVQVQAGIDTEVKFYFDIPTGASVPTGIYKVYLTVWTDWPYASGICVDYIIETFTVG